MAVYKVPQDVEAEDKLLGPFSFRQFVYLIIAGVAGIVTWLLWSLSPFLAIIPLPIIGFFVILALPLRKDQPMEIYLIAVVQFFLKPKRRLWAPDGTMSLVQITAPKTMEARRAKDITENEAVNRLSYLAQIMDTRGWAARGVTQDMGTSVNQTVTQEAEQTEDVLDKKAAIAQSFDTLIEQHDATRRQAAIASMKKPQAVKAEEPPVSPKPGPKTSSKMPMIPDNPYSQFTQDVKTSDDTATTNPTTNDDVHFNPYPTAIHQQVVQPMDEDHQTAQQQTQQEPPKKPGVTEVSPDIINLANNSDFTISTIAHEARRLQEKQDETEVVIPLR